MAIIKRYTNAKGKNCIEVPGVDFGANVEIIKETEIGMLCKVGGKTAWCGRGESKYYEPEFRVFKKTEENEVEECLGKIFVYNRKTKKEVFKKALEEFENLESK